MQQHSLTRLPAFTDYHDRQDSIGEKRGKPRQNINMLVKYRTSRMSYYAEGILCNLSKDGILFFALDTLPLREHIQLMITPDQQQQMPIQLNAEVIRRQGSAGGMHESFNYGCRISRINDPNDPDIIEARTQRSNLFSIMAHQRYA